MTVYLIKRGCKVDAVDDVGNTPLILASQRKHRDVIYKLIEDKASVLVTNNFGQNAINSISAERIRMAFDHELLRLLLKKVKEECSNDSLETAKTLIASHCSFPRAMVLGDPEVTKCMLENGCNVNDQDNHSSALHWAVEYSDSLENVKLLLNNGADVNALNFNDERPIMLANKETDENCEISKLLIDRGSNVIDGNGMLAMSPALFENGSKELIIEVLTKFKLNLMIETRDGDRLVHSIVRNKNIDCTDILKNHYFDVHVKSEGGISVLIDSMLSGNIKLVKFLLEKGADPNVRNEDGLGVLQCVEFADRQFPNRNFYIQYIELILEYGLDPQSYNDTRTIFEIYRSPYSFMLLKPILAQLAMTEALAGNLNDITYSGIKSHTMFRNYFDYCKRVIEKMKKTSVRQTVSLFQCLTESQSKNIIKLVRNEKLVSELESMMIFKRRSKLFYHKLLRKRIAKMVQMVKLRKKFNDVLYEIPELQKNTIIIRKILDYVTYEDLKVIAKVPNRNIVDKHYKIDEFMYKKH